MEEKTYKGLSRNERELSGGYQRDVGEMVNREVYYNISYLVSEMSCDAKYQDDLWPILGMDDFEESGQYHLNNEQEYGKPLADFLEFIGDSCTKSASFFGFSYEFLKAATMQAAVKDWQTYCEFFNVEPNQIEAYEHWIVSDWLADKLEARGEMILKDFHGLTIWGRTTTGQSIHMDSVVCNIFNELHDIEKEG